MLRRLKASLACWWQGHPVKPIAVCGNLAVLRCSRCGIGGLKHRVESPEGKFLPLGREETEVRAAELRLMADEQGAADE